jgi:hypothetical protein
LFPYLSLADRLGAVLHDLTSCAGTEQGPPGPVLVVELDVPLRAAVDAPLGGGDLAREW